MTETNKSYRALWQRKSVVRVVTFVIYKHAAYDCVHFLLGSVQSNHNTTTSGRKTKIAHGRAHVHVQVIAKFENQAQNERELGA